MTNTTNTTNLTLVTGGTGKTGRRVADRLTAMGRSVRIGSRRREPAFDWNDATTWAGTLHEVEAVYLAYYPDLAFPGAAATVGAFAQVAVASGVRRLVLLSGRGEEEAMITEKAVREAGVWTILRSSWLIRTSASTSSSSRSSTG